MSDSADRNPRPAIYCFTPGGQYRKDLTPTGAQSITLSNLTGGALRMAWRDIVSPTPADTNTLREQIQKELDARNPPAVIVDEVDPATEIDPPTDVPDSVMPTGDIADGTDVGTRNLELPPE